MTEELESGYYVAEIAMHKNNPIHSCIVHWNGPDSVHNYRFEFSSEDHELMEFRNFSDFHYLRLVSKIDMTIPNRYRLTGEIDV